MDHKNSWLLTKIKLIVLSSIDFRLCYGLLIENCRLDAIEICNKEFTVLGLHVSLYVIGCMLAHVMEVSIFSLIYLLTMSICWSMILSLAEWILSCRRSNTYLRLDRFDLMFHFNKKISALPFVIHLFLHIHSHERKRTRPIERSWFKLKKLSTDGILDGKKWR